MDAPAHPRAGGAPARRRPAASPSARAVTYAVVAA
ncbi:MAG: hypothetical protein AVDCRST_MAG11-276, partial [uncultured Gemmatimonadaceae bacterium]